jgi:hypothetical protein
MEKRVIPTSDAPHIYVESKGSLTIKGVLEKEIRVRVDTERLLDISGSEDELRVRCEGNCVIYVPRLAVIEVSEAAGGAIFKALDGSLIIDQIKGDLILKDVGPVRVNRVHGSLLAKYVDGDLTAGLVDGNAKVRGIRGSFRVEHAVKGNLTVEDLEGEGSALANGNALLRIEPLAGQKLDFSASGNLVCRLPEDANVEVKVVRGTKINIKLEDAPVSGSVDAPYQFTMGEGEAQLSIGAGGAVLIGQLSPDWDMFGDLEPGIEAMSDDIIQQVESQIGLMESQFKAQLEDLSVSLEGAGLSPEDAERIARRAREASARASARTQEKMKRAQEKIQRKMEAAVRKAEARSRTSARRESARESSWKFDWNTGTRQPHETVPSSQVSDDERMLILQMLQEKKITAEEADRLLQALEGS